MPLYLFWQKLPPCSETVCSHPTPSYFLSRRMFWRASHASRPLWEQCQMNMQLHCAPPPGAFFHSSYRWPCFTAICCATSKTCYFITSSLQFRSYHSPFSSNRGVPEGLLLQHMCAAHSISATALCQAHWQYWKIAEKELVSGAGKIGELMLKIWG